MHDTGNGRQLFWVKVRACMQHEAVQNVLRKEEGDLHGGEMQRRWPWEERGRGWRGTAKHPRAPRTEGLQELEEPLQGWEWPVQVTGAGDIHRCEHPQ